MNDHLDLEQPEQEQAPGDQPPLKVPLPEPPVIYLRGMRYHLEYVRIDRLEEYRRQHGLVRERVAFCGRPGWRQTADGRMRFGGLGYVTVHRRKEA